MSLPEPYSRNAQGAQEIDFHHVPLQSAIRSGVLQDPTLEAQLSKQFPSAIKQLNDIISSKSTIPMPAEKTSTPTVTALNSSATLQEATTSVDRVNTSVKTPTYRFSMVRYYAANKYSVSCLLSSGSCCLAATIEPIVPKSLCRQ